MFFKLSELVVGEGMVVAVGNQNINSKIQHYSLFDA
jgi:hypothetical protein